VIKTLVAFLVATSLIVGVSEALARPSTASATTAVQRQVVTLAPKPPVAASRESNLPTVVV